MAESLSNTEESSQTPTEQQPPSPPLEPSLEALQDPEPSVEEPSPEPPADQPASKDSSADLPAWASFDDVKLEDVPEAARPYVERAQQLAVAKLEAYGSEVGLAKKGFDDAREALNEWVKNIDSSGDPKEAIAQEYVKLKADYEAAQAYVNEVEERHTTQAWDTFKRLHPEIETLPAETRAVFASNIERGLNLFDGDTVIAKLEQALEFSMFKTGIGKQTTRVVDENVEEGRKQAMVASGRVPPAVPQPNNDGLSVDDIIRDALYLLED